MERFSSWKPSTKKTLDEYIEGLQNKRELTVEVDWDDEPLKNKIISLNGNDPFKKYKFDTDKEIEYICFGIEIERPKNKKGWYHSNGEFKAREDRINKTESRILIYGKGEDISITVFSPEKTASMIMNVFFSEKDIWGIRTRKHTNITDDMFYWLFKRFRSYNEDKLSPSSDLYITGLEGYMAKTREDRNVFRGVGHRVGAMLGTLAYLLSNHELRSLKPELQHDSQTFKLEISSNNLYTILDGGYEGRFNYVFKGKDFEKMYNIIIYIDLYIIPKLRAAYKENIDQNLWSRQFKLDFLKDIGGEIADRVNTEVEKIQREIDELDNCEDDGNLDDIAADFEMDDEDMFNELR